MHQKQQTDEQLNMQHSTNEQKIIHVEENLKKTSNTDKMPHLRLQIKPSRSNEKKLSVWNFNILSRGTSNTHSNFSNNDNVARTLVMKELDDIVKVDHGGVPKRRKSSIRKVVFKDNSEYEGEWDKGNLKHGKGVLRCSNGDVYDGEFQRGFRHGYAICTYADGTQFTGYWTKNEACTSRSAIIKYPNGDQYVGQVCSVNTGVLLSYDGSSNPSLPKIYRHGKVKRFKKFKK